MKQKCYDKMRASDTKLSKVQKMHDMKEVRKCYETIKETNNTLQQCVEIEKVKSW